MWVSRKALPQLNIQPFTTSLLGNEGKYLLKVFQSPSYFPVVVHEDLSKNRKKCLSINFASWNRWHSISGRIQPQLYALSQSYRFLMVSLCSSWSQKAVLKRASGQTAGTRDNQDGALSKNHHRCSGELILKEDVIIMILSTGQESNWHPLWKMWVGFRCYAAKWVFPGSIHQYKKEQQKKKKRKSVKQKAG